MPALLDTDQYRALFLEATPMLDLRSPAEFSRGAFPSALSLPLMNDDERAQVGVCYKKNGQQAAIDLGHALVAGDIREQRVARWLEFARRHPGGCLYCWRGGLRSETVQRWLAEQGVDYPRVAGGYKALRRFLLEELERSLGSASMVLVSGKTGTGKTRVIERLQRAIDLEGLANHRGSSFGQMPTPQPSQIDFENSVSIEFMRLLDAHEEPASPIFLEDEGRLIGRVALPENLRVLMKQAPLLVVEEPLQARVDIVLEDYIHDLGERYARLYGPEGGQAHCEKMLADLDRIARRLGGERHQRVAAMLRGAFEQQWRTGDVSAHREWIAFLLERYYDPMYEYQLQQRDGERIFAGSRAAVLDWAKEHCARAADH
ncbi:MAG: tRNA 2-selenouridine(34) synthase MnmH [Halioglobus sp.]